MVNALRKFLLTGMQDEDAIINTHSVDARKVE